MALLAPDGLLYVTDLGTDEVRSYAVGPEGLRHVATSLADRRDGSAPPGAPPVRRGVRRG